MGLENLPRWTLRFACLLVLQSYVLQGLYPGILLNDLMSSFPPYFSGSVQATGFGSSTTAFEVAKANEAEFAELKTVIITGANSGIGFETARVLAHFGAEVILACRSVDKAAKAVTIIKSESPKANLTPMTLDTSSLKSVHEFAVAFKKKWDSLDVLVLNAGVMAPPPSKSVDGIEIQFATNHLGHFLLTELLKQPLKNAGSARVITTSSFAHAFPPPEGLITDGTFGFGSGSGATQESWNCYGQSKLANILHAKELQRRAVKGSSKGVDSWTGIAAYSLNPGFVRTNLQAHWPIIATLEDTIARPLVKNVQQGAATTVFCALDPQAVPGAYHEDCSVKPVYHAHAANDTLALSLWEESLRLVSDYL
ncbi:hypothetical protein CYMTET_42532 [Cymbomonas tetramitiformis]|uniref:NAD(P)-binding protein n=1 Tax=Cymbomonas tetramitiformis TaxID=36881 RepID=A0AAE0F1K2_9CHLO|nr:hypothetical protein CYMTET_42532 [Cymbomonas tetramitiformis]